MKNVCAQFSHGIVKIEFLRMVKITEMLQPSPKNVFKYSAGVPDTENSRNI